MNADTTVDADVLDSIMEGAHESGSEMEMDVSVSSVGDNNMSKVGYSANAHCVSLMLMRHSLAQEDRDRQAWLATQPKINSRSRSGYILFSAEVRKKIMVGNPHIGFGDISRMVGQEVNCVMCDNRLDMCLIN